MPFKFGDLTLQTINLRKTGFSVTGNTETTCQIETSNKIDNIKSKINGYSNLGLSKHDESLKLLFPAKPDESALNFNGIIRA